MKWFPPMKCRECTGHEGLGFARCAWCGSKLKPGPEQIKRALRDYHFLHSASAPGVQLMFQHGSQKHYLCKAKRGSSLGLFIDPDWVAVCTTIRSKELTREEFISAMTLWNEGLEQWRNQPGNISDEKLRWRRWNDLTFTVEGRLSLRPRYLAGLNKQSQLLTVAFFDGGDWCGYMPAHITTPSTSSPPPPAASSPPNT